MQKVIRLFHEAQHLKAPSQRFTDKFGTRFTYAILGLALGMFFLWWLVMKQLCVVSGHDPAMTLLVVP